MPSIFLSHSRIDKPFVEKLEKDLKRYGVNVWYDNWEIKVGDSITRKIEEGIHENEFFGIVLSPEALNSEGVKTELSSAWTRQINSRKIIILPILYRDCNIPTLLADRKYADFRKEYQSGFEELAAVLGIHKTEIITEDNCRRYIKIKSSNWKKFREIEFKKLVTILVDRAVEYNWSTWVGGKRNPHSITLSGNNQSISLKLNGKSYAYMASLKSDWNPNHLKSEDFNIYVGNSINECEEFVWRKMEDFKNKFGNPTIRVHHYVSHFLSIDEKTELAKTITETLKERTSWYTGKHNLQVQ
jgi:hypothetical protein